MSVIILKKKQGVPELEEETRGSKSRLKEEDFKELAELLNQPKTDNADFPYWNKGSIQQLIKDKFGVEYHENYIWALMSKIGFTSQKPQKKDYRKSKEKVETFKKEGAIQIKKSS